MGDENHGSTGVSPSHIQSDRQNSYRYAAEILSVNDAFLYDIIIAEVRI
jgi:hypothetical protein